MYESEVIVADDVAPAILEQLHAYDTVCLGMSEQTAVSRILYGSVAQQISEQATGNVMMVRGPSVRNRTIREALAERLSR